MGGLFGEKWGEGGTQDLVLWDMVGREMELTGVFDLALLLKGRRAWVVLGLGWLWARVGVVGFWFGFVLGSNK